jgi:hypothetical protein
MRNTACKAATERNADPPALGIRNMPPAGEFTAKRLHRPDHLPQILHKAL